MTAPRIAMHEIYTHEMIHICHGLICLRVMKSKLVVMLCVTTREHILNDIVKSYIRAMVLVALDFQIYVAGIRIMQHKYLGFCLRNCEAI